MSEQSRAIERRDAFGAGYESGYRQATLEAADRQAALAAEVERLRVALAWYADESNWGLTEGFGVHGAQRKIGADADWGKRARAALDPHAAPGGCRAVGEEEG